MVWTKGVYMLCTREKRTFGQKKTESFFSLVFGRVHS